MIKSFLLSYIDRDKLLTLVANLFFAWVIFRYALGGWENAQLIFTYIGLPARIALTVVSAFVIYRSDYRSDIPLFIAGYALGYWGEWWGTTRDVWTYWNRQTPPDYLPPLWAIGLLTVYHLHLIIASLLKRRASQNHFAVIRFIQIAGLIILPTLAFAISAPNLLAVDWSSRLDVHLFAGILVGIALLAYRLDVGETFSLYVCGILLGGTYEWLGTSMHEWTYITHEMPPLWIIPLWGLACAAMVKLARIITKTIQGIARLGQ